MKNCNNWLLSLSALLLLTLSGGPVQADAVQDGVNAFDKGDYTAAARAFDTALLAGPKSAELYYDLAMAQMKAGERPKAALSLHRAVILDPRLTAARNALADLEQSQGIAAAKSTWRGWIAEHVPLALLMVSGSIVAWLGSFYLLYGIFKRGPKFATIASALVVVLLGKMVFAAGYFSDPRIIERSGGVVMDQIALLSAPTDQSPALSKLPACSPVTILRDSGEWTYCESATGEKGWAPSAKIAATVPSA